MKLEEIKKIAVIGSGAMGAQMAEVFSRVGGYEVILVDISEELVSKGLKSIDDRLERFFVAKGKITAEEKKAITERIKGSASLEEAAKSVDFVIEAVPEILCRAPTISFGPAPGASPRTSNATAAENSVLDIQGPSPPLPTRGIGRSHAHGTPLR